MPQQARPAGSPDRTEALSTLLWTCDFLKVVSVIDSGAFMYCGMEKDLFVPVGEQLKIMKQGESHIVCIYRDANTGRIAGSSKLNKYLYDDAPEGMAEGQTVDLLVYARTQMGYKVIVDHATWGLLYQNEIFQDIAVGQRLKGYVKKIRPDRRLDVSLHRPGYAGVVPDLSERILRHLQASGGRCPFTDKTTPEEIYRLFGVSKKKFKMAIGTLYKQRRLVIAPDGIVLNKDAQR